MAYAAGVHTSKVLGATGGTSNSINTIGVDLIFIVVSAFTSGGALGNRSDSAGNTWTALTPSSGGEATIQYYYKQNPTTSATHTFSTTDAYSAIGVMCFTGSKTSPFDQQNQGSSNLNSVNPGSITPTENNELIFTVMSTGAGGSAYTGVTGYTIAENISYGAGTNEGMALAYKIQTTAGAENPTWTYTGTAFSAAAIASFKSAAAATAYNFFPFFNIGGR